ncbi:MAG: hypothetical protein A2275_03460 [Bacteroidetes bacterium RIFOXYA12_FULL_35_11]|nr:MAG: hypothetical protein A2X01_17100 [Bacteroidetes bacterium GWF2_35_48]OFY82043.1 MAG: hypothetical protein A2275_03460 [Bacteroidetes bacterium RIFOXYA12_FULL_35_11]OFZ00224.1 MAG: hypothetical protein A2491_08400 [Bacteroidetes bacterium RIFOXYC12_FULL_35_7]
MVSWSFLQGLDIYSWQVITLLIISGFLVGIINTVAGNGTIISFSLFMGLGLPSNIANGTIRLGVVLQTLAATLYFNKNHFLSIKKGLTLAIPTTIGSIIGAQIAVSIDKEIFKIIMGIVMLFMLFLLFYYPQKWLKGNSTSCSKKTTGLQIFIFLLIGIYGGFIHIGVGLFILAALVLISGYNLVEANALKVFLVLIYSPFTLGVFMLSGQIHYGIGLIAAIGNIFGALVGSRLAISWGAGFIRWFVAFVILISVADMFGVFHYFIKMIC